MKVEILIECSHCTREGAFGADDWNAAAKIASGMGWILQGERYICPKCPGLRPERVLTATETWNECSVGVPVEFGGLGGRAGELFTCPCGHKRNLKPGDQQKYCPACSTVAA